jgi:2,4-dienoyl-CoA reductase-like NADH-dependent reductase (Old Yellow Enzyme family)
MINSVDQKRKRVIEEGYADLVAYGAYIHPNPDLVERFEHNSSCRSWSRRSTQGAKGYTDYPNASK